MKQARFTLVLGVLISFLLVVSVDAAPAPKPKPEPRVEDPRDPRRTGGTPPGLQDRTQGRITGRVEQPGEGRVEDQLAGRAKDPKIEDARTVMKAATKTEISGEKIESYRNMLAKEQQKAFDEVIALINKKDAPAKDTARILQRLIEFNMLGLKSDFQSLTPELLLNVHKWEVPNKANLAAVLEEAAHIMKVEGLTHEEAFKKAFELKTGKPFEEYEQKCRV